jgi:light-regulated signal transduction histidine kinase (bacteriophytochrome)/HAMP domain-containing protein
MDHAQLSSVRKTGFVYVLIAISSGAVFAIVIANLVTRQLRLLVAGAKRMAEDRLDEPVPVITKNDVGVLARAFNTAMSRLASSRAALLKARNEFEAEVRERRRAEERIQEANRAISAANENLKQFAYAVSHDLQEPLRGISAYSQLLKKRYAGKLDEDADEFIGYISDGADRMQRLIKAVLSYSRAGAPGGEPASVVDCNMALAGALENLDTAIGDSGAEVDVARLPFVRAHEVAVTQLFQNLIGNAIKYSGPAKPAIRISAERTGSTCTFRVSDNGIGISPEHHQRIFRIFKRAHASGYPGEGVGLAICSKIVEQYAGRIWVESEAGKGADFYFTLPAADEKTGPSQASPAA